MSNIGVAMAGGNGNRREHDFYPTPEEATIALLRAEKYRLHLYDKIWEPACGDGAISKVLKEYDKKVISSDIIDRGYGDFFGDFLEQRKDIAPAIITNPPFYLAAEFIEHALGNLKVKYLALLLKLSYYSAAERYHLFYRFRPAHRYDLTWRLDFLNKGAPTMETAWFIWRGGSADQTNYDLLLRPIPLDFGEAA